jgi:hypothetical protein
VSVNNPVRVGGVRILQQTWGESSGLVLEGTGGDRYVMMPGEGLSSDEMTIILEPAADTTLGLQFARYSGSDRTGSIAVERGMEIAGLVVTGTERRVQSGLQVVHDPGSADRAGGGDRSHGRNGAVRDEEGQGRTTTRGELMSISIERATIYLAVLILAGGLVLQLWLILRREGRARSAAAAALDPVSPGRRGGTEPCLASRASRRRFAPRRPY